MKYINQSHLGNTKDGQSVTGYTLHNESGIKVLISDLGGTIWQLWAPDRQGNLADVVCGYDSVQALEASEG